jgi:hypothetical protein
VHAHRALELYAVFEQTDRTDEYRRLYVKTRRPALQRAWADLPLAVGVPAAGPGRVLARLADAVGDYYETTLLAAVARELAWLTGPLAPTASAWVATLVAEVLGALEPPLAARVATALADARAADDELVRPATTVAAPHCRHGAC